MWAHHWGMFHPFVPNVIWRQATTASVRISFLAILVICLPASGGADFPHVLISEIMYHPFHQSPAGENTRQEYIELFNRGPEAVDLSGWRLSGSVDFRFPDTTLGAGQYLAVAADVDTFKATYPGVGNVVGGWDGKLSNSGEAIELIDSLGTVVDFVRYADQGDWGVRQLGPDDHGHRGWVWSDEHDGGGKSLELINPELPNQ